MAAEIKGEDGFSLFVFFVFGPSLSLLPPNNNYDEVLWKKYYGNKMLKQREHVNKINMF